MSERTVLVLNGPNINMLGIRNPQLYNGVRLGDIERHMTARASQLGLSLDFRQSNHEGILVDWLHEAHNKVAGVIINPAAFTQTSLALADALGILNCPLIELHFANVHRDPAKKARQKSLVRPHATGVIAGFGPYGYLLALEAVNEQLTPVDFTADAPNGM